MAITKNSQIDLNGNEMILDADGDTTITADTDDQIDFKTAGTDRVQINSTGDFLVRQTSADIYDTNSGSSVRQFWGNQFSAQNNTNSRVIIGSASNKGLVGGATVNSGGTKPIVNSYMAFESIDQTAGGEDGVIAFYTSSGGGSGTEKMRVTNDGKVGIGTTSPDVTFEIADTNAYMHIDATNHAAVFIDRASTSYHNNVFYQTADTTNWRIGQMGADNILQVRDEVNDNSNIMVWKHGGNVGIGTASPSSRLHIFDGGSSVNNQITFGNPSATHNAIIHHTAAGSEFLNIECKGTTSGYGNIVFKTGGTPDESMRIDASGNVGIGINPAGYGKLTVSGTGVLAALRASSGAGQLGFYEGGAGRFYLKTLNGADGLSFIDGDGTTERARIDADGTLLINTTVTSTSSSNHDFLRIGANFGYNQAASFNMNGYDDFGALYCDTGGTGVFGKLGQNAAVLSSGMYNYTSASGKPIYFYVDGSYRCQINSTSSGTLGSSDVKFKKDIKDIDYGLDTVKALKPRKFKWKVNEQESIGFIAQEVEKVISEVVHDSEGGADGAEPAGKSLDYAVLTSILTKAIQELSAELDAAKDRIEALEG